MLKKLKHIILAITLTMTLGLSYAGVKAQQEDPVTPTEQVVAPEAQVDTKEQTLTFPDTLGFDATFSYVRIVYRGVAAGMCPIVLDDPPGVGTWFVQETVFEQRGSGFVMKEGYVFTAAHVVNAATVSTACDAISTYVTEPFKVLREEVLIYDYKSEPTVGRVIYKDIERDVAIIAYTPNQSLRPMSVTEVLPSKWMLIPGDKVAAVVHERDPVTGELLYTLKVVYGTVESNGMSADLTPDMATFFNPWDFTVKIEVRPGDSGSPLFLLRKGMPPVVVGIIRALQIERPDPENPFSFVVVRGFAVDFQRMLRYINIVPKK